MTSESREPLVFVFHPDDEAVVRQAWDGLYFWEQDRCRLQPNRHVPAGHLYIIDPEGLEGPLMERGQELDAGGHRPGLAVPAGTRADRRVTGHGRATATANGWPASGHVAGQTGQRPGQQRSCPAIG